MAFDPSKYTVAKARPLPVLLLLDTSGSMGGEKISTLENAVNEMVSSFKSEAAKEIGIQVGIITFGASVDYQLPLQDVASINEIRCGACGPTPMGTALRMAKDIIEDKDIIPSNGYRPTVVLVSDGQPNDEWQAAMDTFIKEGRSSKCERMAMAIGSDADISVLQKFVSGENQVFQAADASKIKDFFRFVTMSVSVRSKSADPNKLLPSFDIQKKLESMMDF